MSDLGTISITVDSSQVRSAKQDIQELGNSYNSASKSASVFMQAFAKAAAQSARDAQYLLNVARANQEIINTNLKVSNSYSSAEASAAAFTKELRAQELQAQKTARANQEAINKQFGIGRAPATSQGAGFGAIEGEILRLEAMYNKVAVAARVYEQAQDSLNKAVLLGVLTSDQKEAKLQELSIAYQKVGQDAGKAQAFINRFGESAQVSGRGLNQFGMYAQQVGYQVGDFLVQIQSGTNPLVAFGQQATQLAGLFPGVLGAALGIGISLTTALGAAFMRTRESAKQAAEGVLSLADAQKQLNRAAGDYALKLEMLRFGVDTEAEAVALKSILDLTKSIMDLNKEYQETDSLSRRQNLSEEIQDLKVQLATQKKIVEGVNEKRAAYEKTVAINEQMLAIELGHAKAIGQAVAAQKALNEALSSGDADDFNKAITEAMEAGIIFSRTDLNSVVALAAKNGWSLASSIRAAFAAAGGGNVVTADPSRGPGFESGGRSGSTMAPYIAPAKTLDDLIAAEKAIGRVGGAASATAKELTEAEKAAKEFSDTLDGYVVGAIDGVANAFADLVVRGFKDFKGFVKSVIDSFKNMIAQMIAIAVKNKILISLGFASAGAGGAGVVMSSGFGSGGLGGVLGSFGGGSGIAGLAGGSGLLGGLGNAVGGGGLFNIGANAAAAGGGVLSTIGAAIPVLGAVGLAFSFFRKKTKELDNGLRITVKNMDALVQTFQILETKRFFGLSKKVSTNVSEASAEISDPIVKAVQDIQGQIIKAAGVFGIAESAFENFLYDFEVSLKGLTEEQKIQKVNEELAKMGDAFASLSGHFETMNELLAAANQRMELQNRLDTLLGNNQAVLQRQREAEIAATHELNRPLLTAIHTLEDAQSAVTSAFAALRASIDKTVEDLQKKLTVANEAVARSRGIFQQLESALSGRYLRGSDTQFSMRRQGALGFLRRGDFSDERQLEEALGVVAEPSEDLFKSFEDYARDFYRTTDVLEDAKNIAQIQLTADEKQVALLEKQIADAQNQYDLMMQQYNRLVGIDEGVLSVRDAVVEVQKAISALGKAMAAAQAAAAAGVAGGAAAAGVIKANTAGQKLIDEFGLAGTKVRESDKAVFQLIKLRGADQLLSAASSLGIKTSGKTGAQIQQEISNKGYLSVNMDNKTRAQKFAMGGMFGGGLRVVGEQGPELEATGPSRIFSKRQTSELFRDPELANSVTELKNEVSRMRSEQLQIQLEISKNTKRIYDTERKWDVEGLPPERV